MGAPNLPRKRSHTLPPHRFKSKMPGKTEGIVTRYGLFMTHTTTENLGISRFCVVGCGNPKITNVKTKHNNCHTMSAAAPEGSHPSEYNGASATEILSTTSSVKSQFWTTLQNGLTNLMSDADRAWKGPHSQDYQVDKALIMDCAPPFLWFTGTTCVLFLTFRIAGNRHFQQFRSRILGTKRKPRKPATNNNTNVKEWKSYSERLREEQLEKHSDTLALPTDMALSFMLGLSMGAIHVDTSLMKKNLEVAPLVPGRSLLSEHLCTDMTELYHHVDPTLWETNQDEALDALQTFVANCRKRDKRAQEIRHALDLPDGVAVSIPQPGVS